ncbi:hypothetical protein BHM03_00048008 [Ensete ventricosum]|nr:hypothetical protein BHM03_00048008 [Ensete ventricosum]
MGIGPGSDDVVGYRRKFARRFVGGIRKLTGNTSGDRQKKSRRITVRMPEVTELAGVNNGSAQSISARANLAATSASKWETDPHQHYSHVGIRGGISQTVRHPNYRRMP